MIELREVPVLRPNRDHHYTHVYTGMVEECVTVNGVPRIHTVTGMSFSPDLHRWAQQRDGVRRRCEAAGIRGLSELTELDDKTMRSIAWDDMQRYIAGGE